MVSRKRVREETEPQSAPEPQEHGLLHQLRNMWEFPNLMQYIYTFGKPMKLDDDIDIEELETECLKPGHSERLLNIGLNLLKFVSSHRGLNYDNFEEYTRRQYLAKAPLRNPFGDDETPLKFHQLDIFQRIRVLQQLSAWTLWNPDRFRERMGEVKESDQLQWRINEIGYDRDEHQYYVLDDNRLYRRIEPQIPPERPVKRKATSRKGRAGVRSSKRRKVADTPDETDGQEDEADGVLSASNCNRDYEWECVAITLNDYNTFIDSLKKSKDLNEQALHERLVEDVLPVIEKVEELQQKKALRREKELIALEKLATAKRSSRIASKQDRIRQEQQAAEEAKRQEAERIAEQKAKEKAQKIEKERQYRLMTREQRLKDREEKRKQQEEELVRLTERAKLAEEGEARLSRRNFNAELEKRQKGLENLEVEDWTFDCSGCGVHGENLDDGSHSVACDKCNVWQHSKCLGISQQEAEKDDFHFICKDCHRRIEEAKRPKIPPLKFRITSSASPPSKKEPQANNGPILTKQQPTNHQNISSTQQFRPAPIEPRLFTSNRPPVASHSIYAQNGSPQPGYPPASQPNAAVPYGRQSAPVQPLPQASIPRNMMSSFTSQRPTSSGSIPSNFPSPVQNRPSISPTQGNGDVGPLAGFPPAPAPAPTSSAPSPGSNGTYSGTTYQYNPNGYTPYSSFQIQQHPQQQNQHQQRNQNQGLQQQYQRQQYHPSSQSPTTSFSATTNPPASFSQTPPSNRYSPGIPMSGLSPTKHSPAQTASSSEVSVQPVVPPVQRLQPSPKLMGRSSSDAPIPAPVKSMAPETILTTNGMPQHHHPPGILNYSSPISTHPISFEQRQPDSQSQCSPKKST
ncbi:PHD finger domain-containing protein [Trichophyton equinum CBS 127.97]|uniref:PHD finger domain-containing protein n=1 Tax=Trichophyton equinum (strain ATCC MYA-4606 / CBS 127.97) TaxID=559882 RepID=F2Q330_TRIEC|nr:PHD finger domain-containing protein [Trichophyton equinum CBS 127.97]